MQNGNKIPIAKIVVISAVTSLAVVLAVAALGGALYYFVLRAAPKETTSQPGAHPEKLGTTKRKIDPSSTDASKITAISYTVWRHVGPLYPGPGDPSGYVDRKAVEFRRDLSAKLVKEKNYDGDQADQLENLTARLAEEQFQELAEICQKYDLSGEPDVTDNISEGGNDLTIEYGGETKRIVTSNTGRNSPGVAELLSVIARFEKNISWNVAGR